MTIDCDDNEAETYAKRITAYLISLRVGDVKIVNIEMLDIEGSKD
jgi:hypothetical protein